MKKPHQRKLMGLRKTLGYGERLQENRAIYTAFLLSAQALTQGAAQMSFQAMTWAVKAELPAKEKFVLIMMANYADASGKCWPSLGTLAKETGLSKSTVQRAIQSLVKQGLVKIESRTYRGRTISNVYKVRAKSLG